MPLYDFKCLQCGEATRDVLIGISEMQKKDLIKVNLKDIHVKCKKCSNTWFTKMLSAHGKTSHNWSSWQRKPGSV